MTANKIFKYSLFDTLRSKLLAGYTLLFLILGFSLFYLGQDKAKSLISLLNIMLLVVPLVSIIIGTIQYYNSREFTELLLAQPIARKTIFFGQYLGLSVSLSAGFLVGLGIPILAYGITLTGLYLLISGILLTFTFVALAFYVSVLNNDKARGIGMSMLIWFYFSVIYDGLVLLILYLFNDYPLEKTVLVLTAFNPIDTSRILILMQMNISALMGVTGALYQEIFGTLAGISAGFLILAAWIVLPVWLARRVFIRKDF